MQIRKITICGGGNGAHALAPIAANNLDCEVDIYAPFGDEAERLHAAITAHGGLETTGVVQVKAQPHLVSADPAAVIPGSDMVFLVLPAFAHESTLRQIAPYLDTGVWVGAMPARGGFDYAAASVLAELGREDVGLFGLQTLPWACRISSYGQVVEVLGVKQVVDIAAKPSSQTEAIVSLLERMLGLSLGAVSNFLSLTLANTGQLIHPGIMYGHFARWDGTPYNAGELPFFYHSLDAEGARTLAGLSDDIQAIRASLQPYLDVSAVHPLQTWLQRSYSDAIADASSLRSSFVTNRAYTGIKAPMREIAPGEFVPDFHARYLSEDVPFGLAVSRAIAELADVATPVMTEVIAWANDKIGADIAGADATSARTPQNYGLRDLERVLDFTTRE